jgi:hypothetical protein
MPASSARAVINRTATATVTELNQNLVVIELVSPPLSYPAKIFHENSLGRLSGQEIYLDF